MDLGEIANNKFLLAQQLHRFVTSEHFELVYSKLEPKEKLEVAGLVISGDFYNLKKLITEKTQFELLSITALRKIGKKLRIPKYNTLLKEHLIESITAAKASDNARRDETSSPGVGTN